MCISIYIHARSNFNTSFQEMKCINVSHEAEQELAALEQL